MFRSRTILVHLARGAVGFALLVAAMVWMHTHAGWAIAALIGALLALRGCPTCWLVGLIETTACARQASIARTCADARDEGACRERSSVAREDQGPERPTR